MTAYFIRRLLLVPITFLIITAMVYSILRFVPGGPIEQAEAAMKLGGMAGGEGGGGSGGLGSEAGLQLDEEAMRELERYYALDKPVIVGYLQWLGFLPREQRTRVPAETLARESEAFGALQALKTAELEARDKLAQHLAQRDLIAFRGTIWQKLSDDEKLPDALQAKTDELLAAGFGKRAELVDYLGAHGYSWRAGEIWREVKASGEAADPDDAAFFAKAARLQDAVSFAQAKLRAVRRDQGYQIEDDGRIYQLTERFSGIVQLDFGRSYTHSEPVLGLIGSKIEISIQFGLTGYLLTWLICIPLGVFKALKHRTMFDTATSFVVFLGYSMPGFVVALLLLSTLAVNVDWIPLGGYKPDNIEQMGFWEAAWGRMRHMMIPVIGYMVAGFATMTILMKNSLLDNLGQDYIRTAFAKGLSERRVIFVHALRNSLIPATAGIGHAIGLLFAGSFLIEKTCNIDGMGLLGFEAILQRDYPVILGILVFMVLIRLFGNILSDIVWAVIDPRIRFG